MELEEPLKILENNLKTTKVYIINLVKRKKINFKYL